MKEGKLLDYFCKNKLMEENWRLEIEEKKAVLTFYSEVSPTTVPKSDERQYCSKDATTPGLQTLLIKSGLVKTWR